MKILFLSEEFPPFSKGGSGVVAYNLARGLKEKGHNIFVITVVKDRKNQGKFNFNGLTVFRFYSSYHPRWRSWLSLYNPQVIFKVGKVIKEIKPDIVHAHNIHYHLSYYCLKIAKKCSKAVFLTAHDIMLIHYGKLIPKNGNCFYKITLRDQIKEAGKRYNPFRNIFIRRYLKYVDKIFAVSDSLKKLLEVNGIDNVITLYNGININEWKTNLEKIKKFKAKYNPYNKKIIFLAGRLTGKAKGGREILEALSLVKKEITNIALVVAGKANEYIKAIKGIAKQLGLEKNTIFTDWLEGDELKAAYSIADICVVPSICFDSFPTVNLEAMASRKPVVGTCFGGTNEIIVNNKTGYLVNPLNTKEVAGKIIDLLKNPQTARQLGEEGYKRVKKEFSLEDQVKKTLEWYNKFV